MQQLPRTSAVAKFPLPATSPLKPSDSPPAQCAQDLATRSAWRVARAGPARSRHVRCSQTSLDGAPWTRARERSRRAQAAHLCGGMLCALSTSATDRRGGAAVRCRYSRGVSRRVLWDAEPGGSWQLAAHTDQHGVVRAAVLSGLPLFRSSPKRGRAGVWTWTAAPRLLPGQRTRCRSLREEAFLSPSFNAGCRVVQKPQQCPARRSGVLAHEECPGLRVTFFESSAQAVGGCEVA